VHRPQRHLGDAERNHGRGMAMDHGVDVRPGTIDLRVDETLLINRAAATIDGVAVEIEFHDVVGGDAPGRLRLGNQETIRPRRMPHADVAVTVDDALVIEDAVGGDEVLDQTLGRRGIAPRRRRLRGGGTEKDQQGRMCREPDRSLHVCFLQPRDLFLVLAIYTRQRRCRQSGPDQVRLAGAPSAGAVRMGPTCGHMAFVRRVTWSPSVRALPIGAVFWPRVCRLQGAPVRLAQATLAAAVSGISARA